MKKLISLAMIVALCAGALGAQSAIKANEEADWPPLTVGKAGKTGEGLAYDLLKELGKRLGVNVSLDSFPMARVEMNLESGAYDLVTAISKSAAREKFLTYSDPWLDKIGLIWTSSSKSRKITSFDDLKGLRVGVVAGNNHGQDFNDAVARLGLKLDESPDLATMLRKLANDRTDVALGTNMAVSVKLAEAEFAGKIISTGFAYTKSSYHIGISKKSAWAARLADINKVLSAMKADGTLRSLLVKYGL